MKTYLRMAFLLVALTLPSVAAIAAETAVDDFYRPWVDYHDGELSIAFDQTPVQFALHAIQANTGFQIVIPATTEAKVINLTLHRQRLEPAVRSLISTIGYKNFALMYDATGRPSRAIVLGTQPAPVAVKNERVNPPLSAQEREKLQKDLERWTDLKQEERGRIEDRLKTLPESEEREQLVKLYGRQILGLKN